MHHTMTLCTKTIRVRLWGKTDAVHVCTYAGTSTFDNIKSATINVVAQGEGFTCVRMLSI